MLLDPWFRFTSFADYLLHAKTKYYLHSTFVYELVTNVIQSNQPNEAYDKLKSLRQNQLHDHRILTFEPAGAAKETVKSSVADLSKRYSLPIKHAELLFRLVDNFKPHNVLETGTGTGFSSAALALGNENANVFTIDGVSDLSQIAREHHKRIGMHNVQYINGELDEILISAAQQASPIDFVYLDANHTEEATLRYFEQLLPNLNEKSCIAVDDIHWSIGMKRAWQTLTTHPRVSLSIDLYRLGLIFTNPGLNRESIRVYY